MQSIIDEEGEGVILRRCGSRYEHGRTHDLIKLKVCFHINIYIQTTKKKRGDGNEEFSVILQAAQGDQEGIVVSIGDDESIEVKLYAFSYRLIFSHHFISIISSFYHHSTMF